MRAERKQALLHQGSAGNPRSTLVEIIFDNQDGRVIVVCFITRIVKMKMSCFYLLQNGYSTPEVVLRRLIGPKSDQCFINKKIATRHEIVELFESAGFNKSIQYYIIKQGQVRVAIGRLLLY